MSDSHEKWINRVDQWNKASSQVPALVREDIVKSKIDFSNPKQPLSLFEDPLLAVQYSMGFKDRINSVSYDTLRRVVHQLGVVGAIINTRCNQVASFAVPQRHTKSLGFRIKHKNPRHEVSPGEAQKIEQLEDFIYSCGAPDPNPHNPYKRDDFEAFLKKYVRDSLTFDAACFEVIPDRRGLPYEFVAVDASTIRMAAKHNFNNQVNRDPSEEYVDYGHKDFMNRNPYRSLRQIDPGRVAKNPDYVQILHGQIETVYDRNILSYGVRNPRSDIYTEGYGYGEIEQLITTITSHLNAETYNAKFFTNGSAPKGIINIQGDNFTPDQIEAFKREWKANAEGVMNAWRTPIMQSENGMEFIDLSKSNVDMEFNAWIEYLIKITCFTADTPITMSDGSLKRIAEVSPGDLVKTHTGSTRKVLNLQTSSHQGPLNYIRAGETIEVTGEHPLYVAESSMFDGIRQIEEPSWKSAKDVVEGVDYLCVPKKGYEFGSTSEIDITNYLEDGTYKLSEDGAKVAPMANRVSWVSKAIPLTEETAFALGLYVAEGNTTDSAAFFTFSKYEDDLVDCVESLANVVGCHSKRYKAQESTANIRVHSGVFAKFMGNAFGSVAKDKRVPAEILSAPEEVQKAFFSGVFAGDGSVPDFSEGRTSVATISLVSHSAVEQLRSMLLSFGVYSHPYTVVSKGFAGAGRGETVMRRIDVNGFQAEKMGQWLGGIKGDRLRHRLVECPPVKSKIYENNSFFFVPVSETWETAHDGLVYNIEVEGEHTYQAHRFAVHNCAVFLIDPAEINFDLHGGVSQTPLFESSNEGKLKQSRDRGLRPLLRFIAKQINDNIISKIDDHYVFDFIGLDELSEEEKQEQFQKQVATTHTLNEIRLAQDLPAIEHGDVPMNPIYVQLMAQADQADQAEAAQDSASGSGGAELQEERAPDGEVAEESGGPQYADGFAKSTGFLEITLLDDFIDSTREQ